MLYVSTIESYKHQIEVLKAVELLRLRGHSVRIKFIGSGHKVYLRKFLSTLDDCNKKEKWATYAGWASYNELALNYQSADIGIFASSCETFGMILLEKMASGLPISCSKSSSMPEILQDGGLYFDPLDPESIASCIEEYLNSPDLREEKIQLSQKRAQEFSWKKCAQETFGFIAEVACQARANS